MAYEVVFIKHNGRTDALVREKKVSGINVLASNEKDEGYGYIKIANSVIDTVMDSKSDWNMLKCINKSKTKAENKVYMTNPNGYVSFIPGRVVNPHKCSLYCTDIMDSQYKAYQLMSSDKDMFNMIGEIKTYLSNKKGEKFSRGRHVSKSNYKGIVAETPMIFNIKKIIEKYGLHCINEIKELIKSLHAHHVNAHWDMRKESIMILTQQEHKEIHSKFGNYNHKLDVVINTSEELNAFLDFVESETYYNLFKREK